MRAQISAVLLAGLAGCAAPAPPDSGCAPDAAGTEALGRALYGGYPELLFAAAAEACDDPGQSVVRAGRDAIRCESLLPPEETGALILAYGGTVDALPRSVISFTGRELPEGYAVRADTYLCIPQQGGGVRLVPQADRTMADMMRAILREAGGRPL